MFLCEYVCCVWKINKYSAAPFILTNLNVYFCLYYNEFITRSILELRNVERDTYNNIKIDKSRSKSKRNQTNLLLIEFLLANLVKRWVNQKSRHTTKSFTVISFVVKQLEAKRRKKLRLVLYLLAKTVLPVSHSFECNSFVKSF